MAQLGEIAYNAYAASRSWRTFNGETMPQWDAQQQNIKEGWQDAAEAVIKASFSGEGVAEVKVKLDEADLKETIGALIEEHLGEIAAR